ncbi:hypothetical protein NE683_15320 [Bariatricus massiliensis]|uniref:Uncharacterized protein n=1 Tax=Bariatricus massiliensis TaxID=1745713 RepID=A0ABS8DI77_9FIRM|nr:hypothetical protein [Bariatricus massiliensis]MCB7305105.1 hypothetical protein [Bariatricus massiliensis]MCB7375554.1 hypothetical protein [Bariatricus massiliensis]MCB7388143.1 hypothetical protein [Bariatricus massiliensis]MCB7412421.1 hypothetical protein [Bariatricus massiliensis]MCQ5254595.1 hypothetical protein [Bariatricus massiliensis]
MENNSGGFSEYDKKIHKFGLISSIIIILTLACVPLAIQLVSGVTPDVGKVLGAMSGALVVFGPVAIIEFLSYTPILGAGGMYQTCITGNTMNMKLPAAQSGQKLAQVEPGSKEADVVSVISIGVSSLVTMTIIFLGMLLAAQLMPILTSKTMAPAFNNLMPAIMGALLVPKIKSDPALASVPCIGAAIVTVVLGYATVTSMQTYLLPVFLILSVAWGYILYKRRQKKQ